jgi:membrane fusion protein, multidrug efflux system
MAGRFALRLERPRRNDAMSSLNASSSDGSPAWIEYSTSTDHVFGEDHKVSEFPQGKVDPHEQPSGDEQKDRPESVAWPMDSQVLTDARGTRLAEQGHPAFPVPNQKPRRLVKRLMVLAIIACVVGVALYFVIPEIQWMLDTTSTDDAFVAGHTTNVKPRVESVVTEVMVERNDRVEPGDVLVRLDQEPFEIALAQSEASLIEARSNLDLARAQVKAQLSTARGAFFSRRNQQEQLRRTIKSLEAEVATLKSQQSSQHLAELDQRRLASLTQRGSATQSELDTRNNTLDVANQRVKEAWAAIDETRATLGLGPNHDNPLEVPKDLVEQQSGIQSAVSSIASSLAQIGIPFDAHDIKPDEAFEQIIHLDSSEGLENAFGRIIEQAPAVKVATSTVNRAEQDLANARLQLKWTEIRSEIAGYVQDRSVNPGDRVETGQTLVSIRPDYVWIDANYKETQLKDIEIGQPVDLYVDAYPHKVFKGRVAGFLPGTGLSESLLPPENATGNYIKVTQRLAVRIELVEPPPKETPLFIGLSVVPYVKIKERPTGPDAGTRLHPDDYRQHPDVGDGPAGIQLRNRQEIEHRESSHK